jgi:septal ring factor EnvC (AmiA/AmiB activator)
MTPAVSLLFLFFLVLPVVASGADARKDLKGIQREIKKKEFLLKTTEKIEQQVSGEMALIEKGLKEKEAGLRRLTADLKSLDQSLILTQRQTQSTQTEVDRKQQEIRKRLVALYKAGDIGVVRIFFSSGSFPQMLESLRYMQAILQTDRKLISDYSARIKTLSQLKVKLEDDARKKEALRAGIEDKKREIEAQKKRKAEYLVKVRKDKNTYAASLKQLEANAARLQAMMQKLEAKSRKSYSKKSAPPPVKDAPAVSRPVAVPSTGFGGRKRQLSLPVQGEIVQRFGKHKHPEFNSFTFSNGFAFSAPAGADIHAVDSGTVIFASYFKGYGNMVILDHGDGFFSVYAHASHIAKKEGSKIARNDVIASVGEVDSSRGPMLYFEIRYQGKPVDPSPWFK